MVAEALAEDIHRRRPGRVYGDFDRAAAEEPSSAQRTASGETSSRLMREVEDKAHSERCRIHEARGLNLAAKPLTAANLTELTGVPQDADDDGGVSGDESVTGTSVSSAGSTTSKAKGGVLLINTGCKELSSPSISNRGHVAALLLTTALYPCW